MTSIEAQKDSVNSLHLQNSAESQKENSQLTNIPKGQNLIDTVNKETNKVVTTDIKGNKDAQHINSDKKKSKNEEMIVENSKIVNVENSKKVKCNTNKVEHRQNAEKLDAISSVSSDNELKTNKNENVKETTSKSGANLKRTRRNIR